MASFSRFLSSAISPKSRRTAKLEFELSISIQKELSVPEETPQSGLSDNAAGALAYVTFIPAIIFLIVEPYNKNSYIKFHSWQSIFLGIAGFAVNIILTLIPIIGWILIPFVGLAFLVIWIIVLLKALKGERFKLPFIGDLAEKQANS
jgi:uncharacterized membrane protein